jgi:hypothetical protein
LDLRELPREDFPFDDDFRALFLAPADLRLEDFLAALPPRRFAVGRFLTVPPRLRAGAALRPALLGVAIACSV